MLPAAGAALGVEDFFAEADGLGRDFDEFVVGDEFDSGFESEHAVRDEANGFVGGGRAHVGLLFFFGDVDVDVGFAGIFADDHTYVNFFGGTDEKFAALLQIP